jgi:hypothetical protein
MILSYSIGKRDLYYKRINKVYDLDIEVDPIDLIFLGDEFFLDGKK